VRLLLPSPVRIYQNLPKIVDMSAPKTSKEVVCIHIGQAGCQVGSNLWELLCNEHNIEPTGEIAGDESVGIQDEPFNAFFSETSSGQHVPRSVFFDTDPASKESIINSRYSKIFHPDNILAYKKDCRNNYFEARTMSREYHIMEELMDRIRLTVDLCHNLQGFFVFRAFGGGTGSGFGCELLEKLRDQFEKKKIFEPAVFPSTDFACSIVEPYNAIFSLAYSLKAPDLTLMLDNQAAYRICKNNLKVPSPTFDHLNKIISQMVSAVTTSLRFDTQLNASLEEIVTNLVPQFPFRYPVMSLAPIRAPSSARHESFTTKEIVMDLFDEKNILCDLGSGSSGRVASKLKLNRYLACAVILRGEADENSADDASSRGGVRSNGSKKSSRRPIQLNDVNDAIAELQQPKLEHREKLRFLPWLGDKGGFKIGVVGEPPVIPKDNSGAGEFMAATSRQGALLANTTAVRSLFVRQYIKFLKLFYHKAYVWQFMEAGGDMESFHEAKEIVRNLIDDYEKLLRGCYEVEVQKDSTLFLEGRTEGVELAGEG